MVAFGLSLACQMGLLSAVILDHFSAPGDHYSALQTRPLVTGPQPGSHQVYMFSCPIERQK